MLNSHSLNVRLVSQSILKLANAFSATVDCCVAILLMERHLRVGNECLKRIIQVGTDCQFPAAVLRQLILFSVAVQLLLCPVCQLLLSGATGHYPKRSEYLLGRYVKVSRHVSQRFHLPPPPPPRPSRAVQCSIRLPRPGISVHQTRPAGSKANHGLLQQDWRVGSSLGFGLTCPHSPAIVIYLRHGPAGPWRGFYAQHLQSG